MTAQEARNLVNESLRSRPEVELKYFIRDVKSSSNAGKNYTYLQSDIYNLIKKEIENLGYTVKQDKETGMYCIYW